MRLGKDAIDLPEPLGALVPAFAANPWRYASVEADATTGLTKFGVRCFDPFGDRWTRLDSLTHLLDLRQGNRCAYAGAELVDSADPSGKCLHSGYTNPAPAAITQTFAATSSR